MSRYKFATMLCAYRRFFLAFLPLVIFLILTIIFISQLLSRQDKSVLPSVFIGKFAPAITLPPLEGLVKDGQAVPGFNPASFIGEVILVNVFASGCVPCRAENPLLLQLSQDHRFRLVGFNYKDNPENARRFLTNFGNPFAAVGTDITGRIAIEWGIYGMPETFLIGRNGKIIYKHVGPLTANSIRNDLMPIIESALINQ